MAENKTSFILYTDIIHTASKLPDEKAGQLFKHILSYVNDENPQTDDLVIQIAFEPIKQALKRDLVKWEQTSGHRSDSGRLGGIKSGEVRKAKALLNEANEANASKTKQNEHVSVIVSDSVSVNKREANFKSEVFLFLESYPEIMLNNFCNYWTEKNKSKTKMRFELEKTFEITRRLATWASRDKTISKEPKEVKVSFQSGPGR